MNIINVSAVWCMSCILMNPIINELEKEYNIPITRYDYDTDKDQYEKYDIKDILPVIIIEKNGKEIKRIVGEISKKELFKIVGDLNA